MDEMSKAPLTRSRARALNSIQPDTITLNTDAANAEVELLELQAQYSSRNLPLITSHESSDADSRERSATRLAAKEFNATPTKSGGGIEMGVPRVTHQRIDPAIKNEVHSRRSRSEDLVESMVGARIGTMFGAKVLRELLAMGILSVQLRDPAENHGPFDESHWMAACDHAALLANSATPPTIHDPYLWIWRINDQGSEKKAALFMNVLAIAAYAAAVRLGLAFKDPTGGYCRPSLRFVTMPNPHRAVPLFYRQDSRPDVLAFDADVFVPAPGPNSSATDRNLLFNFKSECPFQHIIDMFPGVCDFDHALKQNPDIAEAVRAFNNWFSEKRTHFWLDLSRFCWPNVQLTAEIKLKDLAAALLQEFGYMRQHRRTQPWMRYVWGLFITTSEFGLIRADALGVEHCILDKSSSRGALDLTRIVLGTAFSSPSDRGYHEDFHLSKTITMGPRHVNLKKTADDVFTVPGATLPSDTSTDTSIAYTHTTVHFIKLRSDRIHYAERAERPESSTFYVHHIMPDTASLIGRGTRLFCVSRELDQQDAEFDQRDRRRQFIGPYVLKLYHADLRSDCFRLDLIGMARNAGVEHVLLPFMEWRYGDALTRRGFDKEIVDQFSHPSQPLSIPGVENNREEVFALSDMKRMLPHCKDYNEFLHAFIGIAEGIGALAKIEIVHRDLSIGNVLLTRDIPCPDAFFTEAANKIRQLGEGNAIFKQRPLNLTIGGMLHDLDMAGPLHPVATKRSRILKFLLRPIKPDPPQPTPTSSLQTRSPDLKGFRTGTPPYMAVLLLRSGPPHRVEHDLHSLLFVMLLFFLTYPSFIDDSAPDAVLPDHPYPLPGLGRRWPRQVQGWVGPEDLVVLGDRKYTFFDMEKRFHKFVDTAFVSFQWGKDYRFTVALWKLYITLWAPVGTNAFSTTNVKKRDEDMTVTSRRVVKALTSVLDA